MRCPARFLGQPGCAQAEKRTPQTNSYTRKFLLFAVAAR
jgi:hypothetical protein